LCDPTGRTLGARKTERNAQIARDYVEISNLHGRYNHLCLGHYWDKIVDELFAQKTPGVKVEIVESGFPRPGRRAKVSWTCCSSTTTMATAPSTS
jgi:hypothetical protein